MVTTFTIFMVVFYHVYRVALVFNIRFDGIYDVYVVE